MTLVDTLLNGAPNLEATAGIEPLDVLLAKLDASEREWAEGASLYGPGGTFDNLRKSYLSAVALRIRDEKAEKAEKVTEGLIDQMAHADKDYRAFLDQHTMKRARWLALDAQRDGLTMRIQRGQAILRAFANTPR